MCVDGARVPRLMYVPMRDRILTHTFCASYSTCMCVCVYVYLCTVVCWFVGLFVRLFACLLVCLFVCLFVLFCENTLHTFPP